MIGGSATLFLMAGAALCALGFGGVWRSTEAIRRVIAVNVMGNGVFMVFVALAAPGPGGRPDPVPQAMVLTGIVVAVCATGLVLALAGRLKEQEDSDDDGSSMPT